jgi:hypothetical protein
MDDCSVVSSACSPPRTVFLLVPTLMNTSDALYPVVSFLLQDRTVSPQPKRNKCISKWIILLFKEKFPDPSGLCPDLETIEKGENRRAPIVLRENPGQRPHSSGCNSLPAPA